MRFRERFLLIISIMALYASGLLAQETRLFAVLPFENQGRQNEKWIKRGIEEILYDKLNQLEQVEVFEQVTMDRILKEEGMTPSSELPYNRVFQLGKQTGADVLISGSYQLNGETLQLKFRAYSTYTGTMVYQQDYEKPVNQLFQMLEESLQQLFESLGISLTGENLQLLSHRPTSSFSAFKNYAQAYVKFEEGAPLEEVAKKFEAALQVDPGYWEARYNLGVIYFNFKKNEKALQQFNEVARSNPGFYKSYFGMGIIYNEQERYWKAIDNLNQAVALNPDFDRGYSYLGQVYFALDSLAKSLKNLNKAKDLNPNYAPTFYYLGRVYLQQGRFGKAADALREATRLKPDDASFHNQLGEAYQYLQRYDEAIFEFNKAIELNDDYAMAHFNLGNAIYKKGTLEDIIDTYLEIMESRYSKLPRTDSLVSGIRQLRQEQTEVSSRLFRDMVAAYRSALQNDPTFFEAAYNLALTYEHLQQPDSAIYFYQEAFRINPELARAQMRLGRIYEAQQKYDEALQHFKKVVEIDPDYFSRTPRLGEEYRYLNILEAVLKEHRALLEESPGNTRSLLVVARIYRSLGRWSQAEDYYRQIEQLEPENSTIRQELNEMQQERRQM
ncbi:MAG: tetratricopeptide repeat protein [Calditrichia bacterium]